MPEGSLGQQIGTLQTALAGVQTLLGSAPSDGVAGSGLAGAAGIANAAPGNRVGEFSGEFTQQFSSVFRFDSTTALQGVPELFSGLSTAVQTPPSAALGGFDQRIAAAGSALGEDFLPRIQQTLDAIRGISAGIPEDRTAVVSALLDQLLSVLAGLEGPEAERIRSWVQSVQELHRVLMPLIEQAQGAPDPQALAVDVIRRSLESTLDVFGFEPVRSLLDFLDGFLANALPPDALSGATTALASVRTAYGQALAVAAQPYPDFRDTVVSVATTLNDVKARLRPVLGILHRITTAKILQPNALENFLHQQIETALGVQVQEVQRIDDPFQALFDRIDTAIEGIDLSFVRTEVIGFFETTRATIEQVNVPAVGAFLDQQLDVVDGAVQELQAGVTDLLAQIDAFFDDLQGQYRALASNVGQFGPDGTFRYTFEADLRNLLTSARLAVGGDPNDPAAPSVRGSLNQLQSALDQFLGQINALLAPVDQAVTDVATTARQGIEDFAAFLNGLDVAALMEQLRQRVEEILDLLVPVDFNLVVDPVVAAIEENTRKLEEIDADSLNDLLREALKVALDVIIHIDFTAEISGPLKEQFAEVKELPQRAIDELQRRYEDALDLLENLSPERLLDALFAAFDTINEVVGSIEVASLLAPLDALHVEHLQEPLARLRPSLLLRPVADAFEDLTAVFDDVDGAQIIGPLNTLLNDFKGRIAAVDITVWVDDLLAAVERVKQDLRAVRPSGLLAPLVADFARLEAELDRFRPSVLFQPVTELAAPLLQLLENVQQQAITALFELFQAPLAILDRLEPERFTREIQAQIDAIIAALTAANVPAAYNQLRGQFFDLTQAVRDDATRAALVEIVSPDRQLGPLIDAYHDLLAALRAVRENVVLPDLGTLYVELRERLLAMLPPYARALLDPETFRRVMRLADPTRFLQELDERFMALKNKLIPIRPQDLSAELDATYDAVLALVDDLDVEESLERVKETFNRIKGVADTIRVDFVTADIDSALRDFRALVDALDPERFFADLDGIHHEVELVVADTVPSEVLAGLQTLLDQVKDIVGRVDPRVTLGPPLEQAWVSVEGVLGDVDFRIVLSPIGDRLDELEEAFEAGLRRTETAFDQMLAAGRGALSGGGAGAGAGVSI